MQQQRRGSRLCLVIVWLAVAAALAGCTTSPPPAAADRSAAVVEAGEPTQVAAEGITVTLGADAVADGAELRVGPSDAALPTLPAGTVALSPMYDVELDAELDKAADVSFDAPAQLSPSDLLPVVIWQDLDNGWRWLPATWQPGDTTVRTTTDHFSSGFLAGIDIKAWAARTKADFTDYVSGRSGVPQPTCGDEKGARTSGVTVVSDGGDRIKWCFGLQNGKRTLKVSNNTRTFQQISYPGTWKVASSGAPKIDDAAVSRLFGGAVPTVKGTASRIVDGGDTLTLEVPAGASGRVLAEMSVAAWAISGAMFGMTVFTAVASATKSTLASAARGKLDRLALTLGLDVDGDVIDAYITCFESTLEFVTGDLTADVTADVAEATWKCTGALMMAQLADVTMWAAGAVITMISTAVELILTAAHLLISGARDVWDGVAAFGGGTDDVFYGIVLRTPAARRVPAVLAAYPQTGSAAKRLETFVRRVTGLDQPTGVPGRDSCQGISVAGADLELGAADLYLGITTGGECGGDAAGEFYKIRNYKVVDSGFACGDCDPGMFDQSDYDRLTKPYDDRDWSSFDVMATGQGSGWYLRPTPAEPVPNGPASAGQACGSLTANNGELVTVVVAKTPVTCAGAMRLMREYYDAPEEQVRGSAAFWDSPDGWTCYTPTAASGQEQGFGSACDQPSSGARIEAR